MILKFKIFIVLILFFLISGSVFGQDSTKSANGKLGKGNQQSKGFVDADGDGYNDNAPDHDGDGIPNGLDPDYLKIKKRENTSLEYVDSDGDGINDNLQLNWKDRRSGKYLNKSNINITPQSSQMDNVMGGDGKKQGKGKGKGNG